MSAILIASLFLITPVEGTETRTMDIALADLTGDGQLDVIRAVEGGTNQILVQAGSDWVPAPSLAFIEDGSDSEDIAIADLDGDGRLDVVFANEDTFTQHIYFNRGEAGLFPAFDRFDFQARSNTVIAVDLDADGDTDLVFGDSGPVVFLINDGTGHFEIRREAHPNNPHAVQDIEAGDVDADGDLDLVIASEGPNRLLMNNGHGVFTAAALPFGTLPELEETREADFGDLDGDGDLDLYFANVGFRTQSPSGAPDRVLLNDGSGQFTPLPGALPARTVHSLDIDFVDLDVDGDLDGILAASFGGGVRTLINDGSGHFTEGRELAGSELDALDTEVLPGGEYIYVAGVRSLDAVLALRTPDSQD
ncbi:FG-GAP repeat domain-containing protein [Maricaulis sp. D1M11]|uniref:FG-GAP repeat domain-containing protein n=1 Tax=Maricaulis sp. D1M11 TaxID=3076117 RepID=UPI0039B42500